MYSTFPARLLDGPTGHLMDSTHLPTKIGLLTRLALAELRQNDLYGKGEHVDPYGPIQGLSVWRPIAGMMIEALRGHCSPFDLPVVLIAAENPLLPPIYDHVAGIKRPTYGT